MRPQHIDNFRHYLQDIRITDVSEAVQYFNQKHRQKQAKKSERRRQISELRKQIREEKKKIRANKIQKILNQLFMSMRPFLLGSNVHMLNEKRLIISNIILRKLCKFLGYSLPERYSRAYFDTFIVNISDNLAIWLNNVEQNSGYSVLDEYASDVQRMAEMTKEIDSEPQPEEEMYPIDDFIDYSTDDISSASCPSSRNSEQGENEEENTVNEDGEGDEKANDENETNLEETEKKLDGNEKKLDENEDQPPRDSYSFYK